MVGSADGLHWRHKPCSHVPVLAPTSSPAPSPEQLNSFFWISATLRPRSWAGAAHWVKSPMVGRWRSHCESQARWQSQKRWLECRRLQADGWSSQQPQDSSCPPHCPLNAPAWLIPKAGGIHREIQRGLRASVTVAKATLFGSTWGCSAGMSPPFPCHGGVSALLSHQHQLQSWGHLTLA